MAPGNMMPAMDFIAFQGLLYHWAKAKQLAEYGWNVQAFDLSVNFAELQLRNDGDTLYLRDSLDINALDSAAVEAWLNHCLRQAADARRSGAQLPVRP